jgi:cytoskeletal protein RodZ
MSMATVPIEARKDALSSAGGPPRHQRDSTGLGDFLKSARERRGLTLQQISCETKIPRRHLEALEQGNLAAVPGGLYRRAEIRAFARAVRVDQDLALAKLECALEALEPRQPERDTPPAQEPLFSRRRILITITVVVAAAVFGRVFGGRERAFGGDVQRAGAFDSPRPLPAPVSENLRAAVVGTSQRVPMGEAALLSAPLSGSPVTPVTPAAPVMTDAPDRAPKPVSNGDATTTTEQPQTRASAAAGTELVVITEPPGARVTVNGIGWGVTPIAVRYLPPGDKRVRISKDGYASEERLVRVAEHTQMSVEIQLRSIP